MLSIEPVDRLSRTRTWWPPVEQRFGEMRSDESGAAGDERAHVGQFVRWSRGRRVGDRGDGVLASSAGWSGSDSTRAHASSARGTVRRREVGERRLPGDGHRVVHERLDAAPREAGCWSAARASRTVDEHGEEMVDVAAVALRRDDDRRVRQEPPVLQPPARAAASVQRGRVAAAARAGSPPASRRAGSSRRAPDDGSGRSVRRCAAA